MNRDSLFPTYAPPALQFSHGKGSWLTDTSGRQYLDFIAGISVNTLGHAHPALVEALHAQAQKIWHLSNMFDVPGQVDLARRHRQLTYAERAFFMNSGVERKGTRKQEENCFVQQSFGCRPHNKK